jgi:DNA-binding NtrC family response regulator
MEHERGGGPTLDRATEQAPPADKGRRQAASDLVALTVLGHPNLARLGDRAFLADLSRGREALLSREQPRFAVPGALTGEPLGDPFLSRQPLRFVPLGDGSVQLDASGSRTRLAVEGEPVADGRIVSAAELEEGAVLLLSERIVLLLQRRPAPLSGPAERFGLIGESAEVEALRRAIARVAPLSTAVLLRGETGTGKELAARALHEHSPRRGRPFLSVNLAALPPALAAAELFGARKGAYTGSVRDQPGYFLQADGGTLYLDEIGEAPPEIQVMLLRALESGEILPVGDQTPRKVDVRIVSATDSDLEAAIRQGTFRSPLLHRLSGYVIRLPPLRRRKEDLGRLLVHFLRRELDKMGEPLPPRAAEAREPWLPAALIDRLARYPWPGNVRQLQNVARQLAIDGRGQPVLLEAPGLDDLLPTVEAPRSPAAAVPAPPAAPAQPAPRRARRERRPSDVTEDELIEALRAHRWNLKAAADALGVARTSLYPLLEKSARVRPAGEIPVDEIQRSYESCGGDPEAMAAELEVSERALRQRLKDLGLR